jgi:flagellar motor switch protein FliM
MSDAAAPERYDFREPRQLADDVERTLSAWSHSFATLVADSWKRQLHVSLEWNPLELTTTRRRRALETLDEGHVCGTLAFEQAAGAMCLVVPRRFLVGVLSDLLGEPLTQTPDDRELTDVETALVEVILHETARNLTDSQPCSRPLVCLFSQLQRPQDTLRKLSDQEPIVQAGFQVTASFGNHQVTWLLSQQAVLQFMTNVSECRQAEAQGSASLEQTIRQIPMQVVVHLGKANVHVSDLMNLQPGDIVILDQRVSDPLSADVGDLTKFLGWPGRVGTRQAFQIAEMVAK